MNRREFIKTSAALAVSAPVVAQAAIPKPDHVSTGFKALDGALNGGFRRGTINVVLGKAGTGKTLLCNRIMEANPSLKSRFLDLDIWSSWDHVNDMISPKTDILILDPFILILDPFSSLYSLENSFSRQTMSSNFDHLFDLALTENLTTVVTIQSRTFLGLEPYVAPVEEGSPSFYAQTVLSIIQEDGERKIIIRENRHGECGQVIPWRPFA
jgi:hypothetical protein